MNRKLFLLAIAIFFLLINVVNAVRFEEVYYDPISSESGGEAIVLFNEKPYSINLSGWSIKSHKLMSQVIFSDYLMIDAGGYLLITDKGWNLTKDNVSWCNSDFETTLSLSNTAYGLGLYDKYGVLIDKLGWGDKSKIENNFYYVSPAEKVLPNSGESLIRITDTKNNFKDFKKGVPLIKCSKNKVDVDSSKNKIKLELNIYSDKLELKNYTSSIDDLDEEGTQIFPYPGENRSVVFNVVLTKSTSFNVSNLNLTKGWNLEFYNDTVIICKYIKNISYRESPGFKKIDLAFLGIKKNITYEIKEVMALMSDITELKINTTLNGYYYLKGDEDITTKSRPTVKNIGNSPFEIGVQLKDFGKKQFPSNMIVYSFDNNNFESKNAGVMTKNLTHIDIKLNPGKTLPFGMVFRIPSNISIGQYDGAILLCALGN